MDDSDTDLISDPADDDPTALPLGFYEKGFRRTARWEPADGADLPAVRLVYRPYTDDEFAAFQEKLRPNRSGQRLAEIMRREIQKRVVRWDLARDHEGNLVDPQNMADLKCVDPLITSGIMMLIMESAGREGDGLKN